jgi:hypothetical protein
MPSPQPASVQFARQWAPAELELPDPSSHCSPLLLSMTPSPHFASVQLVRQCALGASELPVPSSHCSSWPALLGCWTDPSPHDVGVEEDEDAADDELVGQPW